MFSTQQACMDNHEAHQAFDKIQDLCLPSLFPAWFCSCVETKRKTVRYTFGCLWFSHRNTQTLSMCSIGSPCSARWCRGLQQHTTRPSVVQHCTSRCMAPSSTVTYDTPLALWSLLCPFLLCRHCPLLTLYQIGSGNTLFMWSWIKVFSLSQDLEFWASTASCCLTLLACLTGIRTRTHF